MAVVAFLGLGRMGAPMSANLVAAGHTVRGFDPVPAAVEAAAQHGVSSHGSATEAVTGADVVITMLPHGDAVKQCYAQILPAAGPGTLFIDSSTISVADAREVHALAASHGFEQLDAPVSGGVTGAVAGRLAFMVGGGEDAVTRATPVLEPMSAKIIHCGAAGAARPPRSATTWCWPCSRWRSPRPSCWPKSSVWPTRRCST